MQRFVNQLIPFFLLGLAIVTFAFGVFLLAYLFFFGAIVGVILFSLSWLRQRFFPPKVVTKPKIKSGRIIDSDDWKKL